MSSASASIVSPVCPDNGDSPLSITANNAGILTLAYALLAGLFGYLYLFRSFSKSDDSIARFYDVFAACALESDLVRRDILARSSANVVLDQHLEPEAPSSSTKTKANGGPKGVAEELKEASAIPLPARAASSLSSAQTSIKGSKWQPTADSRHPYAGTTGIAETSPYLLDPDSLARLYSHVRAVEIDLQRSAAKAVSQNAREKEWSSTWGRLLGRGRWINRAAELQSGLDKREALTPRLLVVQMSLAARRLRAQAERLGELEKEVARLKGKVGSWSTVNEESTEDDKWYE